MDIVRQSEWDPSVMVANVWQCVVCTVNCIIYGINRPIVIWQVFSKQNDFHFININWNCSSSVKLPI